MTEGGAGAPDLPGPGEAYGGEEVERGVESLEFSGEPALEAEGEGVLEPGRGGCGAREAGEHGFDAAVLVAGADVEDGIRGWHGSHPRSGGP